MERFLSQGLPLPAQPVGQAGPGVEGGNLPGHHQSQWLRTCYCPTPAQELSCLDYALESPPTLAPEASTAQDRCWVMVGHSHVEVRADRVPQGLWQLPGCPTFPGSLSSVGSFGER